MQIEKKGSGPWPGVDVKGVNVTLVVDGESPLTLDCNALQKDWQVTVDVVRTQGGALALGVTNGTDYVANLIIPPARYEDVPLAEPQVVAEMDMGEDDPASFIMQPTTESVRVPLKAEDMESVRLILWTVTENTQEA